MSNEIAFLRRHGRQRRILLRGNTDNRAEKYCRQHNTRQEFRSHLNCLLKTVRSAVPICADQLGPVVKASVTNVLCSSSWALADPVAGLALAERFTERTGIP